MSKFEIVKRKAKALGASEVGISKAKNKKYYVIYNDKKINFGHSDYQDFLDHKDIIRRNRYRARASKIKNKSGQFTYKIKSSPNFWSYFVIW